MQFNVFSQKTHSLPNTIVQQQNSSHMYSLNFTTRIAKPSLHHHEQQGAGGADDSEEPAEEETGAVFLKPILMHAEYQHTGNKEQSQKEGKHRGGEQG